ncbi:MAG TPA: ATP-binding cassette domain-containing protein [candidate division WOR-3 bacterium]|uniref:ATP-binding cassette domain-containing protein n=1 Tax=candidate division WOR-3 bacterium TaxID=2052148 RepID=A0A9C9EMQ3_UNCW3|nr:ATP-binding cassette domain-containing protein [candidate division WOR-3 bacterium]
MSIIIEVNDLIKIYKVHKKKPGFLNSLKDFFFRKYESVVALNKISFKVEKGELLGYIGPNGAGKTTTLKILSGILYPTKGNVRIMDFVPYKRNKEFLKNIAFIMGQKSQLWWDIPAMETFLLNKEIYSIHHKAFNERLKELTELLDIGDKIHIPVRKLSLGERMKMELIASLLHAPKIIFLDEPTIGLDIIAQDVIRKFLIEYNQTHNATIILTSHYIKDIESICNRIIIVDDGQIIFDGKKEEILKTLLQESVIRIRFKKQHTDVEKIGVVLSHNKNYYVIKIPTVKLKDVISYILQKNEVEEITIDKLQLEDAIKRIYEDTGKFKNN